jgi:hypothetical protein
MQKYLAIFLHILHTIPAQDLMLIPILALAYYIAFIPHQGYAYPIHLDEWFAMANTNELFTQGYVTQLTDPFSGGGMLFWQFTEVGFHLFWGTFQKISGIPWIIIFRYFPGIIMIFTTLSVYLPARKRGFGWEAALFATLVPTTVGVLGPAFLVPVATALLFIPLSLYLSFEFEDLRSLPVLFIFITFLLIIHAFTAIAVAIAILPFIILNLKSKLKRSLGIAAAVFVPFIILLPWGMPYIRQVIGYLSEPQYLSPVVDYPQLIHLYGYIPIVLVLIGAFYLTRRGEIKDYALTLGLLALLCVQVAYYAFHFGMGGVYERNFLYTTLLMSIISGAGLAAVKKIQVSRIPGSFIPDWSKKNIGILLSAILIILTLITVIPMRQSANYYHMIDKNDYEAFVWIDKNVGNEYNLALLDPWKATAFTAVTGKKVFRRTTMTTLHEDRQIYKFLAEGSKDSAFLRDKGISLVYTTSPVENPDLYEVRENIYLFKKNN